MKRNLVYGVVVGAACCAPAMAADPTYQIPEVVVIGVTPLLGSGVDIDKLPSDIQVIHPSQLRDQNPGSALDMLNDRLGSVSTSDYQGNPLQPNLTFRGFNASPVLGDPQGIAVYQNGMRLNESFGDLVNWDMNPSFAIDSLQVMPGSNPVFGLNALGGAVVMKMKDGFAFQGNSVELAGGSFGRARTTVESGRQWGDMGFYAGVSAQNDEGWRDSSPSKLIQGYTDLSLRRGPLDLGMGVTLAGSSLSGLGTTPKDLLDQRYQAIFTSPDLQENALAAVDLRGAYQYSDAMSLQGNVYFRHLVEATHNGDGSGLNSCAGGMCDDNGNPVLDRGGSQVPATTTGLINNTTTHTDSLGATAQISRDETLFGHANTANMGISTDQGWTWYGVNAEAGTLNTSTRAVIGNGDYLGGPTYNVSLNARNGYYGAYATDTYSLTDKLHATLSGRYNIATLQLQDQLGTGLNGDHSFNRFNPAAGLTWQVLKGLTTYTSYSEANRAPTAAELSCANPEQACRVPNAFQSDPGLLQVVSRTVEVGARGNVALASPDSETKDKLGWSLAAYGNRNYNDIIFVNSGPVPGQGYFTNAGITQRTGIDAGTDASFGRWDFSANYGYVLAVFKSNMNIVSPYNPTANAAGVIQVVPGNRMPGIPTNSLKLQANYAVTKAWTIEGDSKLSSSRFLRGDEDNAMKPIPGFAVFNASTTYALKPGFQVFLRVQNLANEKYATAGTLGDPSSGGVLPFTDNRMETPGEPRSFWVGTRLTF